MKGFDVASSFVWTYQPRLLEQAFCSGKMFVEEIMGIVQMWRFRTFSRKDDAGTYLTFPLAPWPDNTHLFEKLLLSFRSIIYRQILAYFRYLVSEELTRGLCNKIGLIAIVTVHNFNCPIIIYLRVCAILHRDGIDELRLLDLRYSWGSASSARWSKGGSFRPSSWRSCQR